MAHLCHQQLVLATGASSFAKRPMKGGLWTPYGISKHESELGLHQLATETGMEVVIIRPPLDYGPGARSFVITGRRSRVTKPARHGPTPLRIAASGYIKGKSWDGRHRSASMRGSPGGTGFFAGKGSLSCFWRRP